MSWLKFNDSLNAIKGQITTFAQEVLAEEQQQPDNNENVHDPVKIIEEANSKIDELSNVCSAQENEIATLKKQINELQQKNTDPISSKQDQNLADSWFWEPENNTSSSSSKNDNEIISKSTSGGDLTIIPLDVPIGASAAAHSDLVDELRKKLENATIENAVLHEKLVQTAQENRELNANIDELDKQHSLAIEEILGVKTQLQEKLNVQNAELAALRTQSDESLDELTEKYETNISNLKLELENSIRQNCELSDLLESKSEILKSLENLKNENRTSEAQFVELQKNNLTLHKEMLELKTQLENSAELGDRVHGMEKQIVGYEGQVKQLADINLELAQKLDKSEASYRELLLEKETEAEELKNLLEKSEKLERNLQAEIIDLQSNLNSKSTNLGTNNSSNSGGSSSFVKTLVKRYSDFDVAGVDDEKVFLEEYLKMTRDLQSKISALEKQLCATTEDKDKFHHEKETLQADLMHYEIECAELMKNNEILLNEIDILKSGKLETIHENNEDSLIILEQQLEDCSNLNRSLEDEYMEVQKKMETLDTEKMDLTSKIAQLELDVEKKTQRIRQLEAALDALETEKSDLIFEINELKTDDHKALHERELNEFKYKIKELELENRAVNDEKLELENKLNNLETNVRADKTKNEDTIRQQQKEINDRASELEREHETVTNLSREIESMRIKLDEIVRKTDSQAEVERANKKYESKIAELTHKCEVGEHDLSKIQNTMREKEEMHRASQEETKKLNQCIADLQKQLLDASENDQLNNENQELKQMCEALTKEKNDLIGLVTVKHTESLQYHGEIQRLSQVLQLAEDKTKQLTQERDQLRSGAINSSDHEKLLDQVQFLQEKSDIMTKNLLAEQANQKLLHQEKLEIVEQNTNLVKDLDRLRQHLMEIEDAHTQETIDLQKVINENKNRLAFLEEEVKKSSSMFTSANIRANQQTETLQAQYMILQQQKDEIASKLSVAEDRDSKNQAALINLQCALEQFQKDKNKDIEMATQRLKNEVQSEKQRVKQAENEIQNYQQQLSEAKNGLLAASRISDQLEISQITINTLKTELQKAQDKYIALENKMHDMTTNQADKVEKSLVKNLLIGYIVSANSATDKLQILKLISSVLDFNQTESDRVGLSKSNTAGWLSNVMSTRNNASGGHDEYNKESLAQAFVKFMEKESQPRTKQSDMPTLLNIRRLSQTTAPASIIPTNSAGQIIPSTSAAYSTSTVNTNSSAMATSHLPMVPVSEQQYQQQQQQRSQQVAVQPILLNESMMPNFAPTRNSSTILKDILNDS